MSCKVRSNKGGLLPHKLAGDVQRELVCAVKRVSVLNEFVDRETQGGFQHAQAQLAIACLRGATIGVS